MDIFRRQDSRFLESSSTRTIKVFRNGDHSKHVEIVLKPSTTYAQLQTEILKKLALKNTGAFLLYTAEGIQLYEDYIPLIRGEDRLYVSLGEEFDQSTSLADFREIRVLGQGGFGKVLLMEEMTTGQLFAVKYVDARKYGLASLIDMVFKEAELLKSLNNRHIVQIVNFFALKNMKVTFVMEYLEGGELGEYLKKKGQLEEEEACEIFKQLVNAVYFCHLNNIIHRDLKLENILFESTNSNIIKVVDFGIAGFYSAVKGGESSAGSLRYMAPEVLTGANKAANPAIDIWSMGIILYALLHGTLPFTGSTRKEIFDKIVEGRYEIAPEVKKKLSPECLDVLSKMLLVDYKKRISTFDLSSHPWVIGEKLPTLPSLVDDQIAATIPTEINESHLKIMHKNKFALRTATLGAIEKKKRRAVNTPEKDPQKYFRLEPFDLHKKSHSKDHATLREQLGLRDLRDREKKISNFADGRFLRKKMTTLEDDKLKEINASHRQSDTPKKVTFPPISPHGWNPSKVQPPKSLVLAKKPSWT